MFFDFLTDLFLFFVFFFEGTRDRQDRNSDANWQYLESSPLRLETHPDIDNLPNFEYYESGNEESQASYPASLDQTSLNLHIKMEPRE